MLSRMDPRGINVKLLADSILNLSKIVENWSSTSSNTGPPGSHHLTKQGHSNSATEQTYQLPTKPSQVNSTINQLQNLNESEDEFQIQVPSKFKRKRGTNTKPYKNTRAVSGRFRIVLKDIICLPGDYPSDNYCYKVPRGDQRERLAVEGLIGKIAIHSTWSYDIFRAEVMSLFKSKFSCTDSEFTFCILQCLPGNRKLLKPNVSSSFTWTGAEIISLAAQGSLYIKTEFALAVPEKVCFLQNQQSTIKNANEYLEIDNACPDFSRHDVEFGNYAQHYTINTQLLGDCVKPGFSIPDVELECSEETGINNNLLLKDFARPGYHRHELEYYEQTCTLNDRQFPGCSKHSMTLEEVVQPSSVNIQIEKDINMPDSNNNHIDTMQDDQRSLRERENSFGLEFPGDFLEMDFEDEALNEAISRSLEDFECKENTTLKCIREMTTEEIQGILQAHSERVINGAERKIYISRAAVWLTAFNQFKRQSFSNKKGMLSVVFTTDEYQEDAADAGGPRRELFRLLIKSLWQDSGAFESSPNGLLPRNNLAHITNSVLKTVGQIIATIIVQGGEPPRLLTKSIVDYIVTENINSVSVSLEDLPSLNIRESLKKIIESKTDKELDCALEECEWRTSVDGLPYVISLETKHDFVKQALLYFVIVQRQTVLQHFIDGLKTYEFLDLLRKNPAMRCLIETANEDSEITSDKVAHLLKPHFSLVGSNRRQQEEIIIVKLREFMQSIEDGTYFEILDCKQLTDEEVAFIKKLKPSHILAFATGSGNIPALGFSPRPRISFIHDEDRVYPIAHTCNNELQLFVNAKTTKDNNFLYFLLTALMNGAVFSTV